MESEQKQNVVSSALVKFNEQSNEEEKKEDGSNKDDVNNSAVSLSSTQYGGHGGTPNVAATFKTKDTQTLDLNSKDKVNFGDELGPVVLNKDGTISRIKNWHQLTKGEQERVAIRIAKRNAKRRAILEESGALQNIGNNSNEQSNNGNTSMTVHQTTI